MYEKAWKAGYGGKLIILLFNQISTRVHVFCRDQKKWGFIECVIPVKSDSIFNDFIGRFAKNHYNN